MLCYATLRYVMLCYIILFYIILYIRDPYSSAEANLLCCVEASRTGGTFCSAFSGPKNVGFTARSHQAPLLDRPGSRDGTPMYTGSTGSTCVAWNRWSTVGTNLWFVCTVSHGEEISLSCQTKVPQREHCHMRSQVFLQEELLVPAVYHTQRLDTVRSRAGFA